MDPHTDPENNAPVAHERTDANPMAITQFGIALALVVIAVQLILWWTFDQFKASEAKTTTPVSTLIEQEAPKSPPEPTLQAHPRLDLIKMHEAEDSALHHYGWVDPAKGIVHIPIERALDIAATRGLHHFPPPPATGTRSKPTARRHP